MSTWQHNVSGTSEYNLTDELLKLSPNLFVARFVTWTMDMVYGRPKISIHSKQIIRLGNYRVSRSHK